MPVFAQAAFVAAAVSSLLAQDVTDWELVVVDDGSPDDVAAALPHDERIVLVRHDRNRGLGAALNTGLDRARADAIAYLPADDVWLRGHLAELLGLLDDAGVALAHTARTPPGEELQLVQIAHRRTPDRWIERPELESDDLDLLFLGRLRARGTVASTDAVTCAWTQHPAQRHRALRPSCDGGPATFRRRYRVEGPLRLHADGRLLTDEPARYARFADRPPPAPGGLRVLLAGELAHNPERILALEDRGCRLYGLWIDDPLGFMTVGPLPFGHVRDVDPATWHSVRPDVVYALLNWRAVPLAQRLLSSGVPLVFHFKEAPQRSIARGEWALLADLVLRADAVILSSAEEREWFLAALQGRLDPARTHVLDGDLPKRDWLDTAAPARRLSEGDGQLHTVLVGRPYAFDRELRVGLAHRGIYVHAPASVEPPDWVAELSRYDAGWLHPIRARNGGDVRAAAWDDLNLPARIPTLIAAGLPLIVPVPPRGAIHAASRLCRALGCGVLYEDLDDLGRQLRDRTAMERRRAAAWRAREALTFDHHADRLLDVLREAAGRV
jgi:glycosyltransferase involved in cell wall biosynthesis